MITIMTQKINQMPLKVPYKATRMVVLQVIFILVKEKTYTYVRWLELRKLFRNTELYLVSIFLYMDWIKEHAYSKTWETVKIEIFVKIAAFSR